VTSNCVLCVARTSCKRHSYFVIPVWSLSEAGFPIPLFPGNTSHCCQHFAQDLLKMAHCVLTVSFLWIMPAEREIDRSVPLRLHGVLPPLPPYYLVWYINAWNPLCDWLVATCHQRVLMVATSVMGWLRGVTIGRDHHMPQICWHHCHASQYMLACHSGTYTLWHYFSVSYVWTQGLIPSEMSVIFSLGQDAILVRFCSEYKKLACSQCFFFFTLP